MTFRKPMIGSSSAAAIAAAFTLVLMSGPAVAQSDDAPTRQPDAQTTMPAAEQPMDQAATDAAPPATRDAPGEMNAKSKGSNDCANPAGQAEPATEARPEADGTAPANAGNTGFTGGLGGSQMGTNPQGAIEESTTWHAPTARGLDLKGRPEPVPASDC